MKQVKLNIVPRSESGSGAAKRIRKEGLVPAVIYGESGTRNLTIKEADFRQLWKKVANVTALIELVEEGVEEPHYAVIQDVQRDVVSNAFVHVDLHEIVRGKPMEAQVAVHVKGEAFGVKNQGGIVDLHLHQVAVRCRPRNLPEFIEIDVTELKLHDAIHIKELPALEGVEYTDDAEAVVCNVSGSGGVAAAEAETEVAE